MFKKSLTALFAICFFVALASTSNLKWKTTSIDLGEIKTNESVDLAFEFTNNSAEPIVIFEAKGSCGCTQVNYPKEAIGAKEKARITAKFKTGKSGAFRKTIRVKTSDSEEYMTLSFNGMAVE